jgi:hypothetical protein
MIFFGVPIPASAWQQASSDASDLFLGMRVTRIEEVPAGLGELLPDGVAPELFGGPLLRDDQVFFVHTERNGEPGTVGVVTRVLADRSPGVARVFDPSAFDALMTRLASPGPTAPGSAS